MSRQIEIVGQGLAGTCIAWALWRKNVSFCWLDRGYGGSSRIAAGMINPLTGKNFNPSWRIAEFLPEALRFYTEVETELHAKFWHPLPIQRLVDTPREWLKIHRKLSDPALQSWQPREIPPPPGWAGAVELHGGGRVDVPFFIQRSRAFFATRQMARREETFPKPLPTTERIYCEGSAGLLSGRYGQHRCAKGEILTIYSEKFNHAKIQVGAGGWLVPMTMPGIFKAGSTYEWDQLDEAPTGAGRARIEEIIHKLGGNDFQVINHHAGVRPILRCSQPLIGPIDSGWMLNGLGSKGALYAPGMAARLASWIIDGAEPETSVDFRNFSP